MCNIEVRNIKCVILKGVDVTHFSKNKVKPIKFVEPTSGKVVVGGRLLKYVM